MKANKLFFLGIVVISFLLISGCDKIDSPYTLKTSIESNRKILLEDFTGHTCANCPSAHAEAKRLQDLYGDKLIVLTVHAGFYALPGNPPHEKDFRTTTGNSIGNKFGVLKPDNIFTNFPYPIGMVNRLYNKNAASQYKFFPQNWESIIDSLITKPADAELNILNSFDPADSSITSSIDIKITNNCPNPINLALYIVEDSIVATQDVQGQSAPVLNYIHRHVLRGSFNGAFGSTIINSASQGLQINRTLSTKLTPVDANVNQVYIYALLFDSVTNEIIQVEEKKLIP